MTKLCVPIQPSETPDTAQRLSAADEAWQQFVAAQKKLEAEVAIEDSQTAFMAFSRFAGELVEDFELRTLLLRCFEQRLRYAGIFQHGAIQ